MATAFDTISKIIRAGGGMEIFTPAGGAALIPTREFKSTAKLIEALENASNGAAGLVPVAKTRGSEVWWASMLARPRLKIVGRLENPERYVVAHAANGFGYDRSVVVLATTGAVAGVWLKAALQKAGFAFYRLIDSTAAAGGVVLHLVELSGMVKGAGDPICKLSAEINGVRLKFGGLLGGYAVAGESATKILAFKES